MPVLEPGQPLDSGKPVLRIDNRLPAGRHRFSLVVIDDQGRASEPDVFQVEVVGRRAPGTDPPPRPPGGPL